MQPAIKLKYFAITKIEQVRMISSSVFLFLTWDLREPFFFNKTSIFQQKTLQLKIF